MKKELIAPCGINCGLCLHYLRPDNKCSGCYSGRKVNGRLIKCGIKLCKEREGDYCSECKKFPCQRLERLDRRYREKYGISEIENLKSIRSQGVESFLKKEEEKWVSDEGVLCIHDKKRYKYF